jgi:hypothetical protein
VLVLGLALLSVLSGPAVDALAAPQASFELADDGTLVLVGNGWRPAQELVINLGSGRFVAYTDSGGEFEVPTGLATYKGALSIHRKELSALSMAPLAIPQTTDEPHPLAILFAQGLARGAALFALSAAAGAVLFVTARPLFRKRRYPLQREP